MDTKFRCNSEELVLYHEKSSVIIYTISLGVGCTTFGVAFTFMGFSHSNFEPAFIFGGIFTLLGIVVLLGMPKYIKQLTQDNGSISLKATKHIISISTMLNMPPLYFSWSDISRIILTKELTIEYSDSEYSGSWRNKIMFFLKNEQPHICISKSPKGNHYIHVDFPKEKLQILNNELNRLSQETTDITLYNTVVFDYVKGEEQFQS